MRLSIVFILTILGVLTFPLAYAIDPIINSEYFTGEYVTVANDTFILIGTDSDGSYWNNYSSVIFKNNVTRSLFKVEKGRCRNTEYYTYCYNYSYYNWDKKFTYEGSILEPSMVIQIFYYNPEVSLVKLETMELEYGRGQMVESVFTNTGSKETVVDYAEQLPAEFIVMNCNICTIVNNKVIAEIRLQEGEEKKMTYFLQYFDYKNFTWTANYNYSYDNQFKSEKKTITSSVKIPYTITESLTQSISNTLGDITTYSFNITNLEEYSNLNINLSIINRVVKDYKGLTKQNDTYTYVGFINARESKEFSIILDSYLVGEFPIYIDAEIETHNHVFDYVQNYSFNVSLNPITPSIIVDKEVANPNDTIHLVASLKNTDDNAQYLYVYANLLPQEEHWTFYKINPGKELILYNDTFPIPEDDDDLYIILSGIYRTTNLQDQTFKLEKIIDIVGREPKPIPSSETNSTSSDSGSSTETASDTENVVNSDSNIDTQQVVPDDSETVISGSNTATNTTGKDDKEKKDFLSSILDAIDSFIKGIFGKN